MVWLLKEIVRPIYFWLKSDAYRAFGFLLGRAGKSGVFAFRGRRIHYLEGESTACQIREIFFDESYDFLSKTDSPVILDCGSNIGLSALYFHMKFPKADLTVIEAHPGVYSILERNLGSWGINPRRIQAAAWTNFNGVEFALNQVDGSSIHGSGKKIEVRSIRLKSLIAEYDSIDFLKMDIEGAELEVLLDCASELYRVRQLFVEFHAPKGSEQKLPELLTLLRTVGFRIYTETTCGRKRPLVNRQVVGDFDLQLNIFAFRHQS